MAGWFLYIIRCGDDSLYTGITTDIRRRMAEHCGNDGKGAKYLRGRLPLTLIYKKKAGTRSEALKRECRVKKMSKVEKERLIKGKK